MRGHSDWSLSTALKSGADIHTHVLPGIDDGAVDLQASVLMAAIAARNGTTLMTASPHRYWGGHENRPETIRALVLQVRQAIAARPWGARFDLRPGQEIPLTRDTAEEFITGTVMTAADNGRYALVEPSFSVWPAWSAEAIARIVAAGITPVLAHPERNEVIQRDPEAVRPLCEAGALIQLTAMSVTGANGPAALSAANWILDNGLATIVSSDCHSPSWRPPTIRSAFRAVRERLGQEQAEAVCAQNPRAVILGDPIRPRAQS